MRWLTAFFSFATLAAQAPAPGRNGFILRGQRQDIYITPAAKAAKRPAGRVLFLPGDGGWRGFAIDIARAMAGWGYEIWGVDTKRYLESFTSSKATLTESEVMADMQEMAAWVRQGAKEAVHLVGWSEGAGLGLLGVAAAGSNANFSGLVALGLPESSVLGWRAADNITWITKKVPNEPAFRSMDYLGKVGTPFLMIHSAGDEYTPVEAARRMFAAGGDPKRFVLVPARNHRYDGARDELFQALKDGLGWLETRPR